MPTVCNPDIMNAKYLSSRLEIRQDVSVRKTVEYYKNFYVQIMPYL